TSIVISKQRLSTAQNRYSIGKASKLDVLNAQVDLNTDFSALLRQQEVYQNTKIQLNEILARDTKTEFVVVSETPIDDKLKLDELQTLADKQNPLLQAQILAKNSAD